MGVLGKPFRLVYQSSGLNPHLTDISAYVMKPDDTVVGLFPLVEFTAPAFQDIYHLEFMTNAALDPEGEYIFKVQSPTEGRDSFIKEYFESSNTNVAGTTYVGNALNMDLTSERVQIDMTLKLLGDATFDVTNKKVELDGMYNNTCIKIPALASQLVQPAFVASFDMEQGDI